MISKSDYASALQCERMLWLKKRKPEEADESCLNAGSIRGGNEVGELARTYYGGDSVLIENDFDYERMARETKEALAAGKTVCEACFISGDLVCLADIVRVLPGEGYELTEVKSTSKVKDHQLDDVAFQAHVMASAGYAPSKTFLLHIDSSYVRGVDLDVRSLFARDDVTQDVLKRTGADLSAGIHAARRAALAQDEPACGIGARCNRPYPCPFQGRCWADVPADSVFDMAGMSRVTGWKWWDKGIRTASDVKAAMQGGKIRPNALRTRQCDGEPYADATALRAFLDEKISWPVYHLDFETFQTAVPRWEGAKPYQQIPSQFSIHVQDEPGGPLRHLEFLAKAGPDPRRAVAEALIEAIPANVCVTAYNMSFEKSRIKELAQACPDISAELMDIHDSIVDLMIPFKNGLLYHPAMGSSCSIKAVLPAFFPDDPELDYHALPTVHNGAQASAAFLELADLPAAERETARNGLLRYCELDTLAMVKVLDAIIDAAS